MQDGLSLLDDGFLYSRNKVDGSLIHHTQYYVYKRLLSHCVTLGYTRVDYTTFSREGFIPIIYI